MVRVAGATDAGLGQSLGDDGFADRLIAQGTSWH
jgi:hypothetical protein